MELQHSFRSQLATAALISLSGVGETIAQNDSPFRQRRQDHFMNMLCARSEHQRHLSERRQAGSRRMQQNLANLFAGRCAARLASDDDRNAAGTQSASQLGDLRTLPAAVEAFECDELSARRHVGNHSRHAARDLTIERRPPSIHFQLVHKQDMTVTEVVSCCLTLPLRTGPDIFALWVDHWEDEWVHDVRSVFSVLWFYFSHRQRPLPPMLPPSRSRWTLPPRPA